MKERLITSVGAIGALALFITLFVHGTTPNEPGASDSRPTTVDNGANGYVALWNWLHTEHIRVSSQRVRFDKAGSFLPASRTGNLLLITLPAARAFRNEELRPLADWIRAGNTVLMLANLASGPDRSRTSGNLAASEIDLLTGLEFEPVRGAAAADAAGSAGRPRGRDVRLSPNGAHPYFNGVHALTTRVEYPPQWWSVRIPYQGFVLSLARTDEGADAMWVRSLGEGQMIVTAFASLFTNSGLGQADNARLLANIIAARVQPGGAVIFDDAHQGLGTAYDTEKFWSDRRLHLTVAILALLWLAWVLGATSLRGNPARPTAPREAELVEATGEYMARVLQPVAAGRRMLQHFAAVAAPGESPGLSVTGMPETLSRHAGLDQTDLQQLRLWCARLERGHAVPLVPLHNLLRRLDKALHL
jgi:hypothetical protein